MMVFFLDGSINFFLFVVRERVQGNTIQANDRLRNSDQRVSRTALESTPTRLGSFINTYLPSGCFMQRSATVRTIPHPLARETFNCAANSVGRIDAVLRTTCRELSRGFAREM
jgi:hypothetical protein